ncbi:hypothetical protein N7490_001689 [Penicillium lividum]|nr:hypothetical protein N7490_001689 [Penicillium lividum]
MPPVPPWTSFSHKKHEPPLVTSACFFHSQSIIGREVSHTRGVMWSARNSRDLLAALSTPRVTPLDLIKDQVEKVQVESGAGHTVSITLTFEAAD